MRNLSDDGFNSHLVETAIFEGKLEIPKILKPETIIVPEGMVPFSQRKKDANYRDFVCFYELDIRFADVLTATDRYLKDLKRFSGVISPDCSVYIDMPLCLQVANIYMNRAVGHYLQEKGMYVIPNVRWGDERTYTTSALGEKVAFLGIPHHSIVSVGTYGCIRGKENAYYFREGLLAMLDEVKPEIVLVYGAMPDSIFGGLKDRTRFMHYPDWIARRKAEAN